MTCGLVLPVALGDELHRRRTQVRFLTQQPSHKDKGKENLEKLLLIQEMLEKSSTTGRTQPKMSMDEVQALTKDDN